MTDEAILNALRRRPGEYVSGEEMSRLIGVSRTAVWKEIQKLREEGYKILAQPHAGYQLVGTPDRLIPQELSWNLAADRIGKRIHAYETTDSTMDVAHRLAAAGEPEGSVVVAEGQSQGRGRLGRSWLSPKSKGIYASVILRPSLRLSEVPLVTLMAAVAVSRAIQAGTGLSPEIKWPNDVLIRGKKVAGILTELNAEVDRVNYIVVGIGMNVNSGETQLPAHATSISEELGTKVERVKLARVLLAELDKIYSEFLNQGSQAILEAWRGFAQFLGHRVRVMKEDRALEGQAVDVDSSGALLIRTDTGFVEPVSAGEVVIVR